MSTLPLMTIRVRPNHRLKLASCNNRCLQLPMRLRPKHIANLTQAEKKAYAQLIGKVDYKSELRTQFVAHSDKYFEGDEHVLPFPERSKPGVMLFSLCQHLAKSKAALFLDPCVPDNILHIKRKLLALGAHKVYALPSEQLLACIYGEGVNPFQYWRDLKPLELPNLSKEGANLLCALEPPFSAIQDTSEWTVRGALLDPPPLVNGIETAPYFKEIAHIGLTEVTSVNMKAWITREPEVKDQVEDEVRNETHTEAQLQNHIETPDVVPRLDQDKPHYETQDQHLLNVQEKTQNDE